MIKQRVRRLHIADVVDNGDDRLLNSMSESKKDISITTKDRTHAVNVLRIILFEKKCLEEMNPYITVKIKRAMLMPVSVAILNTHIQARIDNTIRFAVPMGTERLNLICRKYKNVEKAVTQE